MSTKRLGLALPADSATGWGGDVNANFETLDAAVGGFHFSEGIHAGQQFAHRGGIWRKGNVVAIVAPGTVALADDAINYVYIDTTSGTVTVNQAGYPEADAIPLYQVSTASGAITEVLDQRAWLVYSPPSSGGGGVRTATIVVAAGDATSAERAGADFVCDGVGDHVELLAAIAALPATGGHIKLSHGYFNFGAEVLLDKDYVRVSGQGDSTVITETYYGNCFRVPAGRKRISIDDLAIDGGRRGIRVEGGTWVRLRRLYLRASTGVSVNNADGLAIEDCDFEACDTYGLYADGGLPQHGIRIRRSAFESCLTGLEINVTDRSMPIAISECTIRSAYTGISAASRVQIANCVVQGGDREGILLRSGAQESSVRGCELVKNAQGSGSTRPAVKLEAGADYVSVEGNTIHGEGVTYAGIDVYSNHNNVTGNKILKARQTNIILRAGSSYNHVDSNTVRGQNTSQYGIQIEVGATGHKVTNNDLYQAGSLVNFEDLGTGTVTSPGNRVS